MFLKLQLYDIHCCNILHNYATKYCFRRVNQSTNSHSLSKSIHHTNTLLLLRIVQYQLLAMSDSLNVKKYAEHIDHNLTINIL